MEKEAIASLLEAHPQYRRALAEAHSPEEAVALAETELGPISEADKRAAVKVLRMMEQGILRPNI
jgi:hypothetical protein